MTYSGEKILLDNILLRKKISFTNKHLDTMCRILQYRANLEIIAEFLFDCFAYVIKIRKSIVTQWVF